MASSDERDPTKGLGESHEELEASIRDSDPEGESFRQMAAEEARRRAAADEVTKRRTALAAARPLRSPIVTFLIFFLLFVFLYAVAYVAIGYLTVFDPQNQSYERLQAQMSSAGSEGWEFAKPLLQLAIVFSIVMWAMDRFGFSLNFGLLEGDNRVKAIIAVAVIGGFVMAGLGGLGAISALKDVALVIVGFYFGSRSPKTTGEMA